MSVPTNLKHKPIISVDNYHRIDGIYAGHTDAEALSIGQAQYDENQISLKVWRKPYGKWSRQSEELPIHRNIDLNILFLSSVLMNTSKYTKSSLGEEITNAIRKNDIYEYYLRNKTILEPRLKELKTVLDNFLTSGI